MLHASLTYLAVFEQEIVLAILVDEKSRLICSINNIYWPIYVNTYQKRST